MRVTDIMTADPACCTAETTLPEVAQMMKDNDCGEIPVVEDSESRKLVGVVTDRDITVRAVAEGFDVAATSVGDVMSKNVISVPEDTGVSECREQMEDHQIRRMPVVDAQGRVCGIVAQADIARNASSRHTAELVKDVSRPGGQPQA